MEFGIFTIIHAVLAVFLIIELGLTGWCVDVTHGFWGSATPASWAFMLFNTIWSILVLIYIAVIPLVFARAFHSLVALVLEGITAIFWFAGSIAMAVTVAGGTPAAAVAFGFFIWALFTGLFVYDLLGFLRSRGHSAHADTTHHAKGQTYPGV
ncbi:hypothetical protein HJFPF1_11167 [Paramyrothecium foliicola]|nr:hypothetical protein HJFPF1_11167 [Paramyrothecium foliicola]